MHLIFPPLPHTSVVAARLAPHARMCATDLAEPMSMRVKALKEELDSRGVTWRGVAFE